MADGTIATERAAVPLHVPEKLVLPFDFYSDPAFLTDPYSVIERQRDASPRIYYSPTHYMLPGCWVLTRADDIRHVLQHPDLFSSAGQVSFSQLIGERWDLIPLELDPPTHSAFRGLLNPLFSPQQINKLDAGMRASAIKLIDEARGQKGVEFISAFAHPFPVSVFLQLLGLPLEEMPIFLKWNEGLIRSFSLETRRDAMRSMVSYLRGTIEARRKTPSNDLISFAVHASLDDRALTEDEIIGICFLLFIGGLDTVAASLGFHFRHLATHPELQARLRADRSLIPNAIEEFLRLYSVVSGHRRVTRDTEVAGVTMKKGDWITVPTMNASRDPNEFPNPDSFDLERSAARHVAFAYGVHRCVGSHLARREFQIALNSWFDELPPFKLKAGAPVRTIGGAVLGVSELHLVWSE